MQNYLFAFDPDAFFTFRNINGDDDAATVWHEYTHGLSNRLVTNDDGSGALSTPHAGAMGEAWSDWYALDLLHREGLELDSLQRPGEVDIGVYSDAVFTSTRFTPADCAAERDHAVLPRRDRSTGIGGYTFGDFGKVFAGPEVHSDGEIWLQTLWDLRTQLLLATGSEQDGSDLSEALVTEAMRLSPPEPSFLDERNAILVADQGITGGALQDLIWSVFAGRGMGFYASVTDSSDVTPIEDFNVPPDPDAPTGTVSGTVTSADTGLPLGGDHGRLRRTLDRPGLPEHARRHHRRRRPLLDHRRRPAATASSCSRAPPAVDRISIEGISLERRRERGRTTRRMRRDWAASAGGATIDGQRRHRRPDSAAASPSWSTSPRAPAGRRSIRTAPIPRTRTPGPPTATITLPQPVDISSVGHGPEQHLRRRPHGDDQGLPDRDLDRRDQLPGRASRRSFAPEDRARLNIVPLDANSTGVVKIRLDAALAAERRARRLRRGLHRLLRVRGLRRAAERAPDRAPCRRIRPRSRSASR